jgi:phenylacetic acid degradation operon negative regulatory protein
MSSTTHTATHTAAPAVTPVATESGRSATAPNRRPRDAGVPTRVLVLGMAHEDGVIVPAEVLPVADACGQSPDQVRSCLRRMVAEGLLVRIGQGRASRYEATAAGLAVAGNYLERTRLAYAQDAAGRGWDRRWRLVAFAVPEERRAGRDGLRDRLRALGGAAIQGGLYVSPHPWLKDAQAEAERFGVAHLVTLATTDELEIGRERDPRELARRLWRIDDLARRYADFIRRFEPVPAQLSEMRSRRERLSDADFLPAALEMAVAFQACFEADPLLPPELLPRPWPGRGARELALTSRRLALAIREAHGRPALFRAFDEVIESITP